jgi:hypothetical protein
VSFLSKRDNNNHSHLIHHQHDFWMARGAIILIVVLQLTFVNEVSVGPRWLAPGIELALLLPLSAGTIWANRSLRRARSDDDWRLFGRGRRIVRGLAMTLTAFSTLMNLGSLLLLSIAIVEGRASQARTLLLDALNLWCTNIVVFALWYWTLDRGGPASRGLAKSEQHDFLFTQQQLADQGRFQNWSPGFVDYLFLAFTNATAFSPADTFPLTPRAKLLMMMEATISLITIALVASRAVGILQ